MIEHTSLQKLGGANTNIFKVHPLFKLEMMRFEEHYFFSTGWFNHHRDGLGGMGSNVYNMGAVSMWYS